jgi:hypothetical protein
MKKIAFIILLFAIFSSCKKKEPAPEVSNTGTNTPYSTYTPSNATLFHGIFASSTYTQITGATIYTSKYTGAFFSNTPETGFNAQTGLQAGKVTVNNQELIYDGQLKNYRAIPPVDLKAQIWEVDGGNGIPAIKYMSINNTPDCADFNAIPDSISLSAGFTIDLNGVVNVTTGYIAIADGGTTSLGQVFKGVTIGNNTIAFTPAELSALQTTNYGFMMIGLENVQTINISGKDLKFSKEQTYSKYIKIKP